MRVVKQEQIFVSIKEAKVFKDMFYILEGLEKECESPNTIQLIKCTQKTLNDLWDEIEDID
jgi:hypothetical protein